MDQSNISKTDTKWLLIMIMIMSCMNAIGAIVKDGLLGTRFIKDLLHELKRNNLWIAIMALVINILKMAILTTSD